MRARRLTCAGVVAACSLVGAVLCGPPTANAAAPALVLNYTFDSETGSVVKDRSASGLHGRLVNATAPGAYVTGLTGHKKALKLVGSPAPVRRRR